MVNAQQQDTERFRILVPGSVAINATNDLTQILHDETDNLQYFSWQPWQVVCNSSNGATMTMKTDQAFTHTTNPTSKRNALLWLVGDTGTSNTDPDRWRITKAFGSTDYANGVEIATVAAEANKANDAEFLLQVAFVEESFSDTLEGDYECTVVGTIAPK